MIEVKRRIWASVAALLGLPLLRCDLLAGIHDRMAATTSDAEVDAKVDTCMHAFPPQPPANSDGSGQLDLQFAIRTLDVGIRGDSGAPPPFGYDVDGVCTCPDPPPCAPRTPGDKHCDGVGGRDTTLNKVFAMFASVAPRLTPSEYSDAIAAGRAGFIIRLQHYNGGQNDTQLSASVFVSDGPAPTDDAGMPVGPKWDGNDVWTLDSNSVVSESGPRAVPAYFDSNAYVTGGTLVAHVNFPLRLVGTLDQGSALIMGVDMVLTATIAQHDAGEYSLEDGVIAGRWPTRNVAIGLANFTVAPDAGFTCPGTFAYEQFKAILCREADLFADPRAPDPSALCNALGFGIAFTGMAAKMGPTVVQTPSLSPCPDGGLDDCR